MKVRIKWKRGGIFDQPRREEDSRLDPPPQALVDIHSHVLWGLDDGAHDLEESLAMLKVAVDNGTTDIVATPHASFRYNFNSDIITERLNELKEFSRALPRLHSGCDFHLSAPNINDALANPRKYTINGLNYLMVEFPDFHVSMAFDQVLRQLLDKGIRPVITHPERNLGLQSATARLREWTSMGCVIQVTAQSLTNGFGKQAQKSAWSLLREGLADVIASDAHDTVNRPPRLDHAWRSVQQTLGEQVARRVLITNPAAIIAGKPLQAAHGGGGQQTGLANLPIQREMPGAK